MESIVLVAEGREMTDAVGIGCCWEKSGEDGIRWHDGESRVRRHHAPVAVALRQAAAAL